MSSFCGSSEAKNHMGITLSVPRALSRFPFASTTCIPLNTGFMKHFSYMYNYIHIVLNTPLNLKLTMKRYKHFPAYGNSTKKQTCSSMIIGLWPSFIHLSISLRALGNLFHSPSPTNCRVLASSPSFTSRPIIYNVFPNRNLSSVIWKWSS